MRARSLKIGKVARLAASEERRFGELAGRARRSLDEQRKRLGELHAFRQNYASRSTAATVVRAAHMQDYHNFLGRLDVAIKAQQQIVHDYEQRAEVHRQRWLLKRRRLESFERVLEKYRAEDRLHESRLEQKRLDDMPNAMQACFEADD
jgi:flagellar FliJ protein